jgi:hypothetical protein
LSAPAAPGAAAGEIPRRSPSGAGVPVVAELVFVNDQIVDAEIVAEDCWNRQRSPVLYIG